MKSGFCGRRESPGGNFVIMIALLLETLAQEVDAVAIWNCFLSNCAPRDFAAISGSRLCALYNDIQVRKESPERGLKPA